VSNLDAAKYAAVHDFPGGASALAALVGLAPSTLCNKVNPSVDTHHLSLSEAVKIQAITQDGRILEAEAAALGYVAIRLPRAGAGSDVELLNAYAKWTRDIGETAEAIQTALEGEIDEASLAAIHRGNARGLCTRAGAVRALSRLGAPRRRAARRRHRSRERSAHPGWRPHQVTRSNNPRLTCPHCGRFARIRRSKGLTPTIREGVLECQDAECGWRGNVMFEITQTLSPSLKPNPEVRLPLSPGLRKQLVAESS
jgi:hypothetical protein